MLSLVNCLSTRHEKTWALIYLPRSYPSNIALWGSGDISTWITDSPNQLYIANPSNCYRPHIIWIWSLKKPLLGVARITSWSVAPSGLHAVTDEWHYCVILTATKSQKLEFDTRNGDLRYYLYLIWPTFTRRQLWAPLSHPPNSRAKKVS